MKLSRDECMNLIKAAGMVIIEGKSHLDAYRDKIFYNGERVGTVYYDSVSISPHYDFDENPVSIKFKEENAVERLEEGLNLIVNYNDETEQRVQRVNQVRKYFKDREASAFAKSLHDADRR